MSSQIKNIHSHPQLQVKSFKRDEKVANYGPIVYTILTAIHWNGLIRTNKLRIIFQQYFNSGASIKIDDIHCMRSKLPDWYQYSNEGLKFSFDNGKYSPHKKYTEMFYFLLQLLIFLVKQILDIIEVKL